MMKHDKYAYSILFVEDEVALRKDYVMYLEMIFETVYEASDGEEAYRIYKTKKIDILLIDINLPKLNGLELLMKIRKNDLITKAIILTAHKDNDFLHQAASLKLNDYLVKPITRKLLKLSLEKVIDELQSYTTIPIKNKILDDGYMWDYDKESLSCQGKIIHLTKKEKIIFVLFMNNLNTVLSTDKIIYSVWEEYIEGQESALKTILSKLRRKLPKGIIKNIHSLGYKINA
jgi:DNA-binding response OmpR family regulator